VHPSLRDHVRYLELRLASCDPAALHRAQIEAIHECLEAARAAAEPTAYLAATAHLLPLARAEWIDRYRNAAAVYHSVGDELAAAAAEASAAAAAAAPSHGELLARIGAAKAGSDPGIAGAGDAAAALTPFLAALLEWQIEPDRAARAERLEAVATLWKHIVARDPDFGPERLRQHPPYRHRIPFADPALEELAGWLREAGDALGSPPSPTAPAAPASPAPTAAFDVDLDLGDAIPTAEAVAAGYRVTLAALDESDPSLEPARALYRRILDLAGDSRDGNHLLARMAEERLFADVAREPLRSAAAAALAGLDAQRQPLAAGHYRRLLDELDAARSPTAIELAQMAADLQLEIESAWSNALWAVAVKPLREAAALEVDDSPARREAVVRADRIARGLLGESVPALLAAPAFWSLFCSEIFEDGQRISLEAPIDRLVVRGEVALDVAGPIRGAAIQVALAELEGEGGGFDELQERLRDRLSRPRFSTPEAMRDHLLELHARAAGVGVGGGASPLPVVLWGREIPLTSLHQALADPPRPYAGALEQ
jgi:hypothetical protein